MYDAQLELTIAKILFHDQNLLDIGLIEPNDFFTDTKDAIRRMIIHFYSLKLNIIFIARISFKLN